MQSSSDVNSLKRFRQALQPHNVEIWDSSESLPEEVMQQFIGGEDDVSAEPGRAEELHPQKQIDAEGDKIQLSHFLDGSPRTINVGFLLGSNGISYPVALSHVGATSVGFQNRRWRETGCEEQKMLLLAYKRMGLTNLSLNGEWNLEDPTDKLSGGMKVDETDLAEMRRFAIRRARRRMKVCEKRLIVKLAEQSPNDWLAADGTLFDVEGYSDIKNVQVIGISKSFTLNPRVTAGNNPRQQRIGYLVGLLRELPVGWRSPVYRLTPEENKPQKYTYMWFIRIHKARQSPVSGIIKLELPPSDKYLDVGLRERTIDAISTTVFRLRNPYLYDNRRGESLLYPINVAETLIKSKLASTERLNGIWRSSRL